MSSIAFIAFYNAMVRQYSDLLDTMHLLSQNLQALLTKRNLGVICKNWICKILHLRLLY